MENNKKFALITGGTSGIGLELARLFAADSYNLILVARNADELAETASALRSSNITVETISEDLFKMEGPSNVYQKVKQLGIEPAIVVNNAGQGYYGKFVDNDLERELQIIQLNVNATVALTKYFLRDMVKRGSGKILNVASIAGKAPGPWQAVYHGTKAFIHSFNEAVNSEIKDTGVTLTSLLPGATDTDFFRKAGMEDAKVVQEGKLGDPAAVAKDGYAALMSGDDMVVSGLKNKLTVAMGNVTPDDKLADNMGKMQEPVHNK